MGWLTDPDDELQWALMIQQGRQRAEAAASAWDASTAAWAAHIARQAPWLNPGTALALAKSNAGPDTIATAARAAAADRAQRPNVAPGSLITGAQLAPGHPGAFNVSPNQVENWGTGRPVGFTGRILRGARDRLVARAESQAVEQATDAEITRLQGIGILTEEGGLTVPVNASVLATTERPNYVNLGEVERIRPDAADAVSELLALLTRLPDDAEPVSFTTADDAVVTYDPANGRITTDYDMGKVNPFLPDSVKQAVADWAESHHLPTLADIPLVGETSIGQASAGGGASNIRESAQQALIALNAPVQELQGQVRNIYAATHGRSPDWTESQSDLGIMLNTDMEPGDGLFVDPDSEVAQERLRREAERGMIDGHRVTAGRWFASAVTEPNSDPYRVLSGLVDFGVQVFEPTTFVTGKASTASAARHLFAQGAEEIAEEGAERSLAGLVRDNFTNGVHRPTADAWLNGTRGSAIVERIAEEPNAGIIWQNTGRRLTGPEAAALADATTTDAARDALRPMLGPRFRTIDSVWSDPTQRLLGPTRDALNRMMPHNRIDFEDPTDALRQTERWMQIAHLSDEVQVDFLDRMARASNRNGVYNVVRDVMTHTDGVLAQAGVRSSARRSELTRMFVESRDAEQAWFIDEAGDNVSPWKDVMVNGDTVPGPHLSVEHIGRYLPLPDPRPVRALTSAYPNIFTRGPRAADEGFVLGGRAPKAGDLRIPFAALQFFTDSLWKPVTLLRAAWPVRVVGEEQARMAAAGHASMFRHPLSYIAWAIGRDEGGRATRAIEDVAETVMEHVPLTPRGRRGGLDVLGNPFTEADEFTRTMTAQRNAGGWMDEAPGRVRTGRARVYSKGEKGYVDAWTDELVTLRLDPVARTVARSENLDQALGWFTEGGGRQVMEELQDAHPNAWPGAREYLESVAHRIDVKTGGNADLLDVIRTGTLNGKRILADEIHPTREFRKALDEAYGEAGPGSVKGPDYVYLRNQGQSSWRHGVDRLFGILMGHPTNYLSRSPTFRQNYWGRVEELVGSGDDAARTALVDAAREANLDAKAIKRMEGVTARGELNLDEIDLLAKGHALDETKRLLYDLSERSQIMDAMRLVFPFGEAWREVVTRWATLANPTTARGIHNIRRGQQAIQGARGEEFGELMGAPEILNPETGEMEQQGFFWNNEFGEEVFVYPGSQWLTGSITEAVGEKVPVPLVGRVQGLNMIGSVFPGVGPVAAIPVAWFLPDKPDLRGTLRELLLPFGTITDEGEPTALLHALNYAPPWMRSFVQGISGGGFDQASNRTYANSVMSTANYLYSTGKFDTSTPEGQAKLLEEAKDQARVLYVMRSALAFGAPSAPTLDWLVETNEGAVRFAMLRDDLYRMYEEDYETADERFLERWGHTWGTDPNQNSVALVLQPHTRSVARGLEPTESFEQWRSDHKNLVRAYPNIWPFLAPRGGEFDYQAYIAQIRRGDREALDPEEWLQLSQNRLGWMLMDHARAALGPEDRWDDDDRAWLREIRATIVGEYPGFGDAVPGVEERADMETVMAELGRAVKNKNVRATEAGRGLELYWKARDKVLRWAQEDGYAGIGRAKGLEGDRDWLLDIGEEIAAEFPDFAPVWEQVLRSEVEADED